MPRTSDQENKAMQENISLLLIEDHPDIAAMVCDYFEERGYIIDYAADGITGLHLAVSNEFDAIILEPDRHVDLR